MTSDEMGDIVTVSLNLPKGAHEAMASIASIAIVPIDHVIAVILAIHVYNSNVDKSAKPSE